MKTIILTNGKPCKVEDVDYEFLNQFTWYENGGGYAETRRSFGNNKVRILMHRWITLCPEGVMIDHRDLDRLNNCKTSNLRFSDATGNRANAGRPINNTSGFKGVTKRGRGKTFMAYIWFKGRSKYLGDHKTKESAALAYDFAAIKYFGEFACLNFPETPPNNQLCSVVRGSS